MKTKGVGLAIVCAAGMLISMTLGARQCLAAEAYPTREISVYIGFPAGGGADLTGRVTCEVMQKLLGVPMVIVNKPGASTAIATAYVANSKPDGYTLLWNQNPFPILKKLEEPTVDYSLDRLTLLGCAQKLYIFLAVNASSPWKTYEQFIDHARKNPVKFAFIGSVSPDTCLLDYLATFAGLSKIIRVPFAGGAENARALLAKEVDATIQANPAGQYVRSGDFRFLAVFGPERSPLFPDVPAITEKEKGFSQFFVTRTFLAGPKGLPLPIVDRLTKALKEASTREEVDAKIKLTNYVPGYLTPQENVESWKLEETVYKPYVEQFKKAASK
jgi:tripartite-type tricarboxylate transporter receptor subunit TctC